MSNPLLLTRQRQCQTRLRCHARRRGGRRCHEWAETCSSNLPGHCHAREVTRTECFESDQIIHLNSQKPVKEISVFETLKISENSYATQCSPFHRMTAKADCIFSFFFSHNHRKQISTVTESKCVMLVKLSYWCCYYLDASPSPPPQRHCKDIYIYIYSRINSAWFVIREANGDFMAGKKWEDSEEKNLNDFEFVSRFLFM